MIQLNISWIHIIIIIFLQCGNVELITVNQMVIIHFRRTSFSIPFFLLQKRYHLINNVEDLLNSFIHGKNSYSRHWTNYELWL